MNIYLDEVKFKVEDLSWGSKHEVYLDGYIKVGISEEAGRVLDESIHLYEEKTFDINKLPKEIKDKLVEAFEDIESYLDKF